MKNRFLFVLFLCALFYARGNNGFQQNDSTEQGVQFNNNRWRQILKQAKKTKKYIFVDCYTTWCGPCKRMDKEVYPLAEIGGYMNARFISVKMQMDKTPGDDDETRSQYSDADLILKKYGIPAYPTYFIFSPAGELLSRGMGFKWSVDFLGFVSGSIDPNTDKPYGKYNALLSTYLKGKKDYHSMPALIDTALQLNQQDIADSLMKDYSAYLKTLTDEELYNPQVIEYLSRHVQSSNSRYFHLFHPNEQRINELMGKNGYAQLLVGRVITNDLITPLVSGNVEPDWNMIEKPIIEKYDSAYAGEYILKAKAKWYEALHDYGNEFKYFTLLLQKYGGNMDANNGYECANNFMDCDLNSYCWELFKYSVEKEQIDEAIKCMGGVIKRYRARVYIPDGFIDTYANLLYKAGRSDEAIKAEEEQIDDMIKKKAIESEVQEFRQTLQRMKEGRPTWPRYIGKDDYFGMGLM